MSSVFPGVFGQGFPILGERARSSFFWERSGEKFCWCRPDFVRLSMGHMLFFAILRDLVPVQLHQILPELLPPSMKPRNVANSWSTHLSSRRRLGGSARKFAASFFFCMLHYLFQHRMHHTSRVPCQVRPASPTRTALLPEPIWHQKLFGSTNLIRSLVSDFSAENMGFLLDCSAS